MTEYIWFKGGHPSKHTEGESGERPTKVFLGGGVEIHYSYHENGNVWVEKHYKNGKTHRDGDKPAYFRSDCNGNVWVELYTKNGKKHRDGDKPAYICYHPSGNINCKEYYKNGNQYKPTKTT